MEPEGIPAAELADSVRSGVVEVLGWLTGWLDGERWARCRLVVVTCGGVPAGEAGEVKDLVGASVWGLVRSVQSESPGRVVLADVADGQAGLLVQAAGLAESGEWQVAARGGALLVPRLTRVGVPAGPAGAGAAGAGVAGAWGGTVLLSGGLGGLAGLTARHLVEDLGVRSLVAFSRRGVDGPGAGLAAELAGAGAAVTVMAADVADRGAVAGVLAGIGRQAAAGERPALSAVVHVAGVVDDGVAGSLSAGQVERVLAPKVDGALVLDELTRELDLSAFIMFSRQPPGRSAIQGRRITRRRTRSLTGWRGGGGRWGCLRCRWRGGCGPSRPGWGAGWVRWMCGG